MLSDEPTTELQLKTAEYEQDKDRSTSCAACQTDLTDAYYEVNGSVVCERCGLALRSSAEEGPGPWPPLRAIGAGLGAAILGAALYYVVLTLTGYEIGLVAIVVGFLVGRAVRWGSGGRGGGFYQAVAVGLTYIAIVSTYVPFIVQGLNEAEQAQPAEQTALADPASTREELSPRDDPGDEATPPTGRQLAFVLAVFALFVLASPLLAGFQNIIGWLIIGFALYEAWRVNRRLLVDVTGPYALGQPRDRIPASPPQHARP